MAAYNGRTELKQLPYLKAGYKGKNANGGRKTELKQSREYKDALNDSKIFAKKEYGDIQNSYSVVKKEYAKIKENLDELNWSLEKRVSTSANIAKGRMRHRRAARPQSARGHDGPTRRCWER